MAENQVPALTIPTNDEEFTALVFQAVAICELVPTTNEQTIFIAALMQLIRLQYDKIMELLGRNDPPDPRLQAAFEEAFDEARGRQR